MPRSVGTSEPSSSWSRPLSRNGSARSRVDPRRRDALQDPQAQEHLLEVGVRRLEPLVAAERQLARLDARHVLLGRTDVPPAAVVAERVRAGAEPEVRRAAPSTPGCGGTRTPASPSSRPRSGGSRRRAAGRTPRRTCRPAGPDRARAPTPVCTLRPSAVAGSIVSAYALMCSGARSIACSQRPLPRVQALAVRAVDEVEVHVLVAGGAGGDERPSHAVRRVQALERLEHAAIERLRAHRQPVEPGRRATLRASAMSTVSGFASIETSASSRTANRSRTCVEHALQVRDVERRRRPSAEEDRHDLVLGPRGRRQAGLGQQRPDVPRRQVVEPRVRVEVAVAAARQAERHVDVDADVAHFFFSLTPLPSSTRNAAMNASCGTSTRPTRRIRALPFFCSSSSLRLRVMSPP